MKASHFFIGRGFNARAIEAYDRDVEATNPSVSHDHDYEPDARPGFGGGVVCRSCGFRVSGDLAGMVAS